MNEKIFRLGELYCGPGGLACGALRSRSNDGKYRINHAWANDYDADTCETYIRNICPNDRESVYLGDVRELDISALGPIDAFAYGFPCNSEHSVAGYSHLLAVYFEYLVILLKHVRRYRVVGKVIYYGGAEAVSYYKNKYCKKYNAGYEIENAPRNYNEHSFGNVKRGIALACRGISGI